MCIKNCKNCCKLEKSYNTFVYFRPNFFELCNPRWEDIDCGANSNYPKYITNYTCQGHPAQDDKSIEWGPKNAHLSFVSGHASMACQSATFIVLYLQSRIYSRFQCAPGILFLPLCQLVFIILAFYTCLTRISDYWHHPGDVLGK